MHKHFVAYRRQISTQSGHLKCAERNNKTGVHGGAPEPEAPENYGASGIKQEQTLLRLKLDDSRGPITLACPLTTIKSSPVPLTFLDRMESASVLMPRPISH